jgi:hypothetical protein
MTNSKCIAGRPEHTIIAVFALLIVLFAIGIVLTFKAYVRQGRKIVMQRGSAGSDENVGCQRSRWRLRWNVSMPSSFRVLR